MITEADNTYYHKSMQILALVAETEQDSASDTAKPRGTLRISEQVGRPSTSQPS
nr:hypothetical protein [uncultured Cohaesibacter sp.]